MRVWRRGIGLAGVALLAALSGARADDTVTADNLAGFSRLTFDFAPMAHVAATAGDGILTLHFDRKTTIDPQTLLRLMGPAVSGVHADADGRTFRFALTRPVLLHQSQVGAEAAVDVAPAGFTGTMPDLPPPAPAPKPKPLDPAKLPVVALRVGSHSDFTRLVFDWPKRVPYRVFGGAGVITVTFQAPAKPDLSAIARFTPAWVKNAAWHLEGRTTVVRLETDPDSRQRNFRDGTRIVLDVLAPKADAAVPRGASSAQGRAILATAAKLNANIRPAATPQPRPVPQSQPVPVHAVAADTAAPAGQQTQSQITANGITLTFKGAGQHPAAVFVRGLTAWIVLEDAPAFDAAALKTVLGGFHGTVEAAASPGAAILRLGLPRPEAIAARKDGSDLKVAIGETGAAVPATIAFSRDENDAADSGLNAFLPLADRSFTLTDPVAGDRLIVIPGAGGYGVPVQRAYATFSALPSAQGLVLAPRVDDLNVAVADTHIRLTRAEGLHLTPPDMAMDAAVARESGQTFLDFAAWKHPGRGTFLAIERRLRRQAARESADGAGEARRRLAQFYLANHFAAEALGLIDLIRASDPAATGDARLTAMRGAAEYMMGRDKDALNDLASARFDADPHIALWRGLSEAALDRWSAAHADLARAAPVLHRYPLALQARAALADAEAGLGLGRMDMAAAALARLPHTLSRDDALEAELARARLAAQAGGYHAAAPLFAAVAGGGDERLAVRAIYYRTDAGLKAGAIAPAQAIETLERLRFRWRGDDLELMTLRRLAGLYFHARQWRKGLQTLRVATDNFPDTDGGRAARDDMRAAFVNLFLKGGADHLAPVKSLGLFYANIDLTPIGPDGDEMIRRMADRLVRVDLLGPAETLLAWQVDKRLDGIARASVATRLAGVYLMDHKPRQAIAVLHDSRITGLPDATIHTRLLLEARGFAALKQWDNALDLIATDDGADTRRLRADIYWESGQWETAGQQAEQLLGNRFADPAPLDADERALVLRMAVAYSLADDEASLERLRTHFAARMAGTPDADSFAVLSQPIEMHGLAFRDAAAKIASLDTLEAFMKDFNSRRTAMN